MPVMMEHEAKAIPPTTVFPPWTQPQTPTIVTSIPGVTKRGSQTELERRALAMEFIDSTYPLEEWTHIYTDGSATEATRNGGAGVLIRFTDGEETQAIPTGRFSTNFRAEAEALSAAAETVSRHPERTTGKVVIMSDALSVLLSLNNNNNL